MLFAHIADTHLGYRQFNLEEREIDFYNAFHESIDLMISEGVDVMVHAGDLFDEPRPSIRALVEAKKGIEKLKENGIKTIMVPGNHDKLMRKGAMLPHAIFDGVTVLSDESASVVLDDVFIGGVPYVSKSYRDSLIEGIASLEEESREFKRSIMVLHQGIDRYLSQEYELTLEELPKTFNYYALGHVHRRVEEVIKGTNVCYSGSTEIWRSPEALDWKVNGRGFLLVDTDNMSPKRITLEGTRPFITGEIRSEEDISIISEEVGNYEAPVIQLTIQGDDFNHLEEIVRRRLSKSALYLIVKRKALVDENLLAARGVLDVEAMIAEMLKDFDAGAGDFGKEMYGLLSNNDSEGALLVAKDFYDKWKEGGVGKR